MLFLSLREWSRSPSWARLCNAGNLQAQKECKLLPGQLPCLCTPSHSNLHGSQSHILGSLGSPGTCVDLLLCHQNEPCRHWRAYIQVFSLPCLRIWRMKYSMPGSGIWDIIWKPCKEIIYRLDHSLSVFELKHTPKKVTNFAIMSSKQISKICFF